MAIMLEVEEGLQTFSALLAGPSRAMMRSWVSPISTFSLRARTIFRAAAEPQPNPKEFTAGRSMANDAANSSPPSDCTVTAAAAISAKSGQRVVGRETNRRGVFAMLRHSPD